MIRRRGVHLAAVLQLVVTIGLGGVLIAAGVAQARTPAPAAHVQPLRPATEAERRQWQVDQLADLLEACAARPACEQTVSPG